jgi:hypothetical protein
MMLDPKEEVYFQRCEEVASAMEQRNISASIHTTLEETLEAVIKEIPDGSLVGLGGSMTLEELGLVDRLREEAGRIYLLDRYQEGLTPEELDEIQRRTLTSDVFICSANAVTMQGELVYADGEGNRIAALLYGPPKVIVVAGINKLVSDIEEGYWRIREVAAPMNAKRLGADTPCRETGFCDEENCDRKERICNILTIIENQKDPERMSVHLVTRPLGY